MYGYNQSSSLWESIRTNGGQLMAYIEQMTNGRMAVRQYPGIESIGSQQQFVANTTGTTWCPSPINIGGASGVGTKQGDTACFVANTTGTDPIVAIQWRWYDGYTGTGLVVDGPIVNLPVAAHINAAQFYVTINGIFNEPHKPNAFCFKSALLGVRLTAGGIAQTIQMDFRGLYY
jgi:hypothetical protein